VDTIKDFFDYSDAIPKLNRWAEAYAKGKNIVSDKVYDDLYKAVKEWELDNSDMIDPKSPTQGVIDSSTDGFPKVKHDIPMISIANSNSHKELKEFSDDRASKKCPEQTIEFKIDGLALSLKYEHGMLQDAVTRGKNGVGDRVYLNALQIPAIKKKISITDRKVEIRGEVVWLKDDFEAWNKKQEALGNDTMSNPRNGAAGTMKSKDPKEVAERKLSFVAYSVVHGSDFTQHDADMLWLKGEGFITSEYYVCITSDKILKGAVFMEKKRHTLPYLIDGLVIKVNDKTAYKRLGGTSKTPHYCTALKFPPEEKETDLLDVEKSAGRTGAVTPVAIVKEIELALTKVNRASIHNWDIAEYIGVYEGCKVIIRKAGEIIPEIVKVVGIDGRSKDDYEKAVDGGVDLKTKRKELLKKYPQFKFYTRPEKCDHCGSTLQNDTNRKGETLVAWVCKNVSCSVKQFKNIVKFASKDAMDISGVSESMIEKLLSKGLIKDITGLFKVTEQQLLTLDGVQQGKAKKYMSAIEYARKNNYMHQFLAGVGIPNLGKTAAKNFAEHFGDLETFHQAQQAELEKVTNIGSELAENIVDFRKSGGNRYLFRWFIDKGICTKAEPSLIKTDKLKGLVLIMTGTSDKIGRQEFKDMVAENSGYISSGISGKVNYVIVGDNAGPSKLQKIADFKKKGVDMKTITDDEFLKMIN